MTSKTTETQQARIPVVLVMTGHPDERDMEKEREAEMRSLLDTAGRSVVGTLVQHVQKQASGTYIGSGKVEELKAEIDACGAQQVVFDVPLSPRQQRNLEEAVEIAVLDYDELILDIFARNARTTQAMLAVELAQAEYDRARVKRMWTHLDRQTVGGSTGIGSVRTRSRGWSAASRSRDMQRERSPRRASAARGRDGRVRVARTPRRGAFPGPPAKSGPSTTASRTTRRSEPGARIPRAGPRRRRG